MRSFTLRSTFDATSTFITPDSRKNLFLFLFLLLLFLLLLSLLYEISLGASIPIGNLNEYFFFYCTHRSSTTGPQAVIYRFNFGPYSGYTFGVRPSRTKTIKPSVCVRIIISLRPSDQNHFNRPKVLYLRLASRRPKEDCARHNNGPF